MADKSNLPDKRRPGLISRTLKALEEGLTGVGAEIEQKGALQSIGQVLQRVRGKTLVEDLHREWMRLRQSGKIEPDYEESAQYLIACMRYLNSWIMIFLMRQDLTQ